VKRYDKDTAIIKMNTLGAKEVPFVFVIDFEMQKIIVSEISKLDDSLHFDFPNFKFGKPPLAYRHLDWLKYPINIEIYQAGFDKVMSEILLGNSFLTNLAYPTNLQCTGGLTDIYHSASAKYKMLLDGECTMYSPETFVKIDCGNIYTYPMKGTIDASLPEALQTIINDEKELAEHYTIVDLLRNDLSIVAKNVEVTQFRYPDYIKTNEKDLIQISSEIKGRLPENYTNQLGSIIFGMLPAGSVSGAPKKKTIEIIRDAEGADRGYYTGVCGYFDGKNIDSAVIIRYVEQTETGLVYKSGGGITSQSDLHTEYQEMIDKVYIPGISIEKQSLISDLA